MNRCKRLSIYIYKCLQYFKNRADILTQLSGTSAFWASRSPLEDYHKNQQYSRLMSAASFLWTTWRVFTSSQLFLEEKQRWIFNATQIQTSHNNSALKNTNSNVHPRVLLVQSQILIHGFTKVSEHCYSAEMMPTFLFCSVPLICSRWGRCTCGRHLNASLQTWFNAREKAKMAVLKNAQMFYRLLRCLRCQVKHNVSVLLVSPVLRRLNVI